MDLVGGVRDGGVAAQVVTGREKNRLAWNWIATLLRHKSREETVVDFHARKLKLITYDSRTDASADQQAYTKACDEVFAMVGSMSAFDSGGASTAQCRT